MRTKSLSASLFLFLSLVTGSTGQETALAEASPQIPVYYFPVTSICVDPYKNSSSTYGGPGQLPACDDATLDEANYYASHLAGAQQGAQAAAAAAGAPFGLVLIAEKDTTTPKEEIRFQVDVTNGVTTEPPTQTMTTSDGLAADTKFSQHLFKWIGVPNPRPEVSVKNIGAGCISVGGTVLRPQEKREGIVLSESKEVKIKRGLFTLTYYAHTIPIASAPCPPPPMPSPRPTTTPTPTPPPPMPSPRPTITPTPTPPPPMPSPRPTTTPTPTPPPPMPSPRPTITPTPTPPPPMPSPRPTITPTPTPPPPMPSPRPTITPTPTPPPPMPSPRPTITPTPMPPPPMPSPRPPTGA